MFDVSSEFEDFFNWDRNNAGIEVEFPANVVNGIMHGRLLPADGDFQELTENT